MKKRLCMMPLLAFNLFFPTVIGASSEENGEEVECLVVSLADGSESKFSLAETPVLTFDADSVAVTCGGSVLKLALADVADYRFSTMRVPTAIIAPPVRQSEPKPSLGFGEAVYTGLKAGTTIRVHTLDGRLVKTVKASEDGSATVILRELGRGVYILRTPGRSVKIYNR